MSYILTIQIRKENGGPAISKETILRDDFIENEVYALHLKFMIVNPIYELMRDLRKQVGRTSFRADRNRNRNPNEFPVDQDLSHQIEIDPQIVIQLLDIIPNISMDESQRIENENGADSGKSALPAGHMIAATDSLQEHQGPNNSPKDTSTPAKVANQSNRDLDERKTGPQVNQLGSTNMAQLSKAANKETSIQVIVRERVLAVAHEQALEDIRNEMAGILLGKVVSRPDNSLTVVVIGVVRALKADRGMAHVNISPEAWMDVWRLIDKDKDYQEENLLQGYPMWRIVGWYHTHPGLSVFFSSLDQDSHSKWFRQAGHIALVIDPVANDYGFFCWNRAHNFMVRTPHNQVNVLGDLEIIEFLGEYSGVSLNRLPSAEL
jgi:proteasome lid subunit RPN8/RPN11